MDKKKVFGIIIVLVVILALVGMFFVMNNKKEEKQGTKKDDNKNEQVKEEITESTTLLDLDFDCDGSTLDSSNCKILYYNENGDRVVITDKSPTSVFGSFDKDVYYVSNDNFIHIYNVDTKEDKKTDIQIKEELYRIQINSKYLMIEQLGDSIILYNKNDLSKIDVNICSASGKLIKDNYVYNNCDNKVAVYNISTKKDKILLEEETLHLDIYADKDKVLLVPTESYYDIFLYDLKEDKLEKTDIERSEPIFEAVLLRDNVIVYTDYDTFYKYDINTKKTIEKQVAYDFYNSKIINNKLVYVYNNIIQEFDLLTFENKKLYTIDKKIVNVENSKDNKIEFESTAYNHNFVITKRTDIGSKIDCTGGECHGTVKEKKEYYIYNYANNTFKKLDVVETYESEE